MNDPNQFNNPPPGGMPPQGAPGGFPPPGGAPYQQPAGGGGTPGIVIAGLICAFLCPLVGLILSIIGRGKAKEAGSGVGLATAGIIISAVFIVISIIANIAAA
jgi:hypothetical protein